MLPKAVRGFGPSGMPKEWPLRYSIAYWTVSLPAVKPGQFELRVRTVDRNGFAQSQPRPNQQSGRNLIPSKQITVA